MTPIDPRGLGRSSRKDGRVDNAPIIQADDVHAVIEMLRVGPVEMFASSGGAVTALGTSRSCRAEGQAGRQQRKPRWLVVLRMACACRAAGR